MKHLQNHLPMAAMWHLMAGPQVATCGSWKISKQAATRFCGLPSYPSCFPYQNRSCILNWIMRGETFRVESRSQNACRGLLLVEDLTKG